MNRYEMDELVDSAFGRLAYVHSKHDLIAYLRLCEAVKKDIAEQMGYVDVDEDNQ